MLPFVLGGALVGGITGMILYKRGPPDHTCSGDTDWIGTCLNAPLTYLGVGIGVGAVTGALVGAWSMRRDAPAPQP